MNWHAATIAGYLVLVVAGIVLELEARRAGSRIPSLRVVFSRIMRTRAGRFAIMASWVWVGMHFFAR